MGSAIIRTKIQTRNDRPGTLSMPAKIEGQFPQEQKGEGQGRATCNLQPAHHPAPEIGARHVCFPCPRIMMTA